MSWQKRILLGICNAELICARTLQVRAPIPEDIGLAGSREVSNAASFVTDHHLDRVKIPMPDIFESSEYVKRALNQGGSPKPPVKTNKREVFKAPPVNSR